MSNTRILEDGLTDEVLRAVLREATRCFNNELLELEHDERQLLLDRSKRLRSQPKLVSTS